MPFQKMHILRAQKSARSEGVGSVEQTKLSRLYFISIGHWLCQYAITYGQIVQQQQYV